MQQPLENDGLRYGQEGFLFGGEDGETGGGETPPAQVFTVTEAVLIARDLLEQTLLPMWVRGEISNLTIHRSGHVYFTLKDGDCELSAAFFRGAAEARRLALHDGMEVTVWGRLTIYPARGRFQIVVTRVRPGGLGALQQQFEELRRRLQAEGLFDEERKRPIPALPRCVGVVTSPDGAAIRDFIRVLWRRFGGMQVRICPASVQGERAAREIAAAIRWLNRNRACDVIVVTRGGGSIEDLWPFNEEIVARAIAESEIPVISAVGHERDFTIADFAADLRAATPSAAAERLIQRREELQERIENLRRRLVSALKLRLERYEGRMRRINESFVWREPARLLENRQQRVDELVLRLTHGGRRYAERLAARVDNLRARLRALDPRAVLERGYAVLLPAGGGAPVTDARQAAVGDELNALLARGSLGLTVRETRPPEDAGSQEQSRA